MSEEEFAKSVKARQDAYWIHPLTCGNESQHDLLIGVYIDGEPRLKCPTCGWVQTWLPPLDFPPCPEILKGQG